MPRITRLTDEQQQLLPQIRDQWIAAGLSTAPADWNAAILGVHAAYLASGLIPPRYIIRVASPWAGAVAQAAAAAIISRATVDAAVGDTVHAAVDAAVGDTVRATVDAAVDATVRATVDAAVGDTVRAAVDDTVGATVRAAVDAAVGDTVGDTVRAAVHAAVRDTVRATVDAAVDATVRATVDAAVGDTVRAAVDDTVGDTVRATVDAAVDATVRATVDAAVGDTVRAAVDDTVGDTVRAAVHAAVRDTVRATVDDTVGDTVRAAVHDTVGDTVRAAVHATVRAAVRAAVDDTVGDTVRAAVRATVRATVDAAVHDTVGKLRQWWQGRLSGQHWAGYYSYYYTMGRLGVDEWRLMAGQMLIALSAGWWWAYRDFAIVTDRPEVLERDANGQLHSATGMAIRYRDGWGAHCWHGRRVPAWVIENPTPEKIAAEPNVEVRRCAIESLGWDRFTAEAQLTQVGTRRPDPGNPGQHLTLYDVPERLWGSRIRLLLATNGSTERDGTRRRYGLTVPAHINDPLEAAAWTYGLTRDQYARAQRRT